MNEIGCFLFFETVFVVGVVIWVRSRGRVGKIF